MDIALWIIGILMMVIIILIKQLISKGNYISFDLIKGYSPEYLIEKKIKFENEFTVLVTKEWLKGKILQRNDFNGKYYFEDKQFQKEYFEVVE